MNSLSEEVMTGAVIEKVFLNETGEKTDLEKLIADSIAQRDARRAAEEAAKQAEEARYTAIFNSIVEGVIELVRETIPAPLRPYLKHTGGTPFLREGLDARTWYPDWLHVQAPGLAEIAIGIARIDSEGAIHLGNIITGGVNLKSSEWSEVIAAAFDHYHNQRRAYSEAARGLG